jgi:pimeloyl-ACP methyl ester carboxylesterase
LNARLIEAGASYWAMVEVRGTDRMDEGDDALARCSGGTGGPWDLPYLLSDEVPLLRTAASSIRWVDADFGGSPLRVWRAGAESSPPVLLFGPIGVSYLTVSGLMIELAQQHQVVGWETSISPARQDRAWNTAETSRRAQLQPVRELASTSPWSACQTVIAFCSGAYLALSAIARGMIRKPRRLVLMSPPIELVGGAKTIYQETFLPLLRRVATGGPVVARLVHGIMKEGALPVLEAEAAELEMLNGMPFRDPGALLRYAALHAPWLESDWKAVCADVRCPTLVLHGSDDLVVHPESARALATALSADFQLFEGVGHFGVHFSSAMRRFACAASASSATGDDGWRALEEIR